MTTTITITITITVTVARVMRSLAPSADLTELAADLRTAARAFAGGSGAVRVRLLVGGKAASSPPPLTVCVEGSTAKRLVETHVQAVFEAWMQRHHR